eukprot:CAMPEP_0181232816 /NCGR_PEP_ID=MMETSP1096-20121128/35967_1 /TAXON_ID=156174 ORGANISM="Chrysochromulina ericina, Strain CCMP281" /NCGR_SAMPLE_ID=MMETSP1096 /ASSEMBLY_ACC=CAM_ASM_000453 /LENGTH=209 /DNA_ID=CAMNT_0023327201 /DNA_START=6 /DNA_END=635 /DNA_ORIENTATION=+
MTEIVQQWKALPEVERRDFEDRATEEQKRYLAACIKERQERCTADEAVEEEGDEPTMGAEELAVQLPLARITKIIRLNNEIVKIGRDACFLVTKATEQFLERATWEAAKATTRAQRKTIFCRDVVASMSEHPNPESMQIFIEELQPKPPPDAAPPSKPTRAPAKKRPASKAAHMVENIKSIAPSIDGAGSSEPTKDSIQLPPKKAAKRP